MTGQKHSEKIQEMVTSLGVLVVLRGYKYIMQALNQMLENDETGSKGIVLKEIYSNIAQANETSHEFVMFDIDNAIHTVSVINSETYKNLFSSLEKSPPSSSVFLKTLKEQLAAKT